MQGKGNPIEFTPGYYLIVNRNKKLLRTWYVGKEENNGQEEPVHTAYRYIKDRDEFHVYRFRSCSLEGKLIRIEGAYEDRVVDDEKMIQDLKNLNLKQFMKNMGEVDLTRYCQVIET